MYEAVKGYKISNGSVLFGTVTYAPKLQFVLSVRLSAVSSHTALAIYPNILSVDDGDEILLPFLGQI